MQHKPSSKEVSLWQIFTVFAKIGAFTIGGGYAMIPLIQAEMSRRGWISEDELPDIVALSQSAPGVMAVNISIFAGHNCAASRAVWPPLSEALRLPSS